ncbi:23S rRNA (guanosine(2251)-2'-O)-methyltransferase RlmB [Pistricoccus aurantiacus]|uniref:23S rRNA (guanosine(2251)-2'-O)-methyltransferase RlmB n=1 Tax=Pistricoccus aurantiacus TaxID=1883414 RepID=UPI0036299CAD
MKSASSKRPDKRWARKPRPNKHQASKAATPFPEWDTVFGMHAVQALLDRKQSVRELWVLESAATTRLLSLVEQARTQGVRVTPKPREILDDLAQATAHQGVIAFCPPVQVEGEESLWLKLGAWQRPEPPLLLILDGVTDVHNFGACLRSADAAGAHGVIVPKDKAAPLNATVRKVACGAAESVPVYQVTNLARAMARLKEFGVWITGTAGEASQSLYEGDFTDACALVMGAEGKGMRRLTREACDALVNLPMVGQVSSLNVSVATGVCLFEVVRQRRLAS